MASKEAKIETFLSKFLPHDMDTWWNGEFIVHHNQSGDYDDYYDDKSKDHLTPDNIMCKELINNTHDRELDDEEVSIINFSQDFNNNDSLFIHPNSNRYHANMLFNSLIDKDASNVKKHVDKVDENILKRNSTELEKIITHVRTIHPDMRQSFYGFCMKYTS